MKRLLNAIPLLVVMLFALVGPAAAQSSWLPTYSPTQQLYIAPGVDSSLAQSFENRATVSDVQAAARVHNLVVLVVVTASGDDAGNDARQAGPVLVRKLWDTWSKSGGFPADRAVLILMTGDGRALTSVGVRAGGYLNSLGIQRNTMNDTNGPVIPVLRSYLTSDPASVPGRIVSNINAIVTAKLTPPANTGSGTTEGDSSMGTGTILLIVGGLFALAILFIVVTRPQRPPARTPSGFGNRPGANLRKPGSGFESRIRNGRNDRPTRTGAVDADVGGIDDDARRRNDDNTTNTAAAVGAGVVGGVLLGEAMRRDDEPRRDSGSSSSDAGYVAPVTTPSCSSPSSSPSCSSGSSGSSCSSGGSSCGGGGGGGCGGGG